MPRRELGMLRRLPLASLNTLHRRVGRKWRNAPDQAAPRFMAILRRCFVEAKRRG